MSSPGRKSASTPSPLRRTGAHRGSVTLFFAVIFALTTLLSFGTAAADTPDSTSEPTSSCLSSGPCVEVVSMIPEILTDEAQVTLSVRVSGITASMGSDLRLATFMQADPFTDVEEVDSFLAAGRNDGWSTQDTALTPQEVADAGTAAGSTVTVTFNVADAPLWNEDAWGPYGVTVRLIEGSQLTYGDALATGRTLLLWYPTGSTGTTNINIVLSNTEGVPASSLAAVLTTGVAAALSPRDTVALARNGLATQVEVVPLPEENASLSLLATTGQDLLYDLAEQSRLTDSPSRLITLVHDAVLADEGWMTLATVQRASPATVLTPPSGIEELIDNSYTASSRVLVDSKTGQTIVTSPLSPVTEGANTAILDSWTPGSRALSDQYRSQLGLTELSARQRTRAFTATVTQEDPGDVLNLWVNADAQTLGDDLEARLSELLDVPWVHPVTLKGMLSSPASGLPRDQLNDFPSTESVATATILKPLEEALSKASSVLAAATSEEAENEEAEASALRATAAGLNQEARKHLAAEAVTRLEAVAEVVSIVPSSTVNVMGKNVSFPVTVTNSGAVGLNLLIGLEVTDSRLSAPEWVSATVPAHGSVTVQVPVTAVGAGQVGVLAVAKTTEDATLDVSSEIKVNVRADWEDTGTWIAGGALVALFVFGLVRTIRRGRRRTLSREEARERRGE